MEGSVCSCDGDTMQDELYSIHQDFGTTTYLIPMHLYTLLTYIMQILINVS